MKYHQTKQQKNDYIVFTLKKVNDKFNYDGVSFPASLRDINVFEKTNKQPIWVYGINKQKEICTIREANKQLLKENKGERINLLLLKDNESGNTHYA